MAVCHSRFTPVEASIVRFKLADYTSCEDAEYFL